MRKVVTPADSPVSIANYLNNNSQVLPEEAMFFVATEGAVEFTMPRIQDLPQTQNLKVHVILGDADASATVNPDSHDTICSGGSGVALELNAGYGENVTLQPVELNPDTGGGVWSSVCCCTGD